MSDPGNQTSVRAPVAAIVGVPAALAAAAITASWRGVPGTDFWFWFTACLAGELLWVRLALGGITMNMALACNFGALLLLGRGEAMIAATASTLIAEAVFLRKPMVRCVFNSAQSALSVGAASLTLGAITGGVGIAELSNPTTLVGVVAAALVYFAVNSVAVSLAVSLADGLRFVEVWRTDFGSRFNLMSSGALFSLGTMMAVAYMLAGPLYSLLGVMPILVTYAAYRMVYGAASQDSAEKPETRRAA
jgi:hypothetical protein